MVVRILGEGRYDVPDADIPAIEQLDAQLNELGYKAGAPASRSTLIVASEDGGDEAGLAARAEAAGVDIATRRAAEANLRRSQHQENAR